MLFKLLRIFLAKNKSISFSEKNTYFTHDNINFELKSWLRNKKPHSTQSTNKSLNERVINNLTGRDGWDDNKVHTEGPLY